MKLGSTWDIFLIEMGKDGEISIKESTYDDIKDLSNSS